MDVPQRKAKRYKDLIRETVIQKMEDDESASSHTSFSDNEHAPVEKHRLAYDDEQVALRAAFLDSIDANDDDELVLRRSIQTGDSQAEEVLQKEMDALAATKKNESPTLVDPRGEVKDGENFLLEYFKNRRWVDTLMLQQSHETEKGDARHDTEVMSYNSQDSLNDLEKTEAFESKYNFRFEEAAGEGGPQIVSYSRTSLSDTLRRKDDARKLKREQRKEKKLAERRAKEEKLKRLKNAKREEMEERVKKIKGVIKSNWTDADAGQEEDFDENVLLKLLDGDYDADNFDQLMSKAFGDSFYDKKEDEWKTDDDVRASCKDDPEYRDAMIAEGEEEDGGEDMEGYVDYTGMNEDQDYDEEQTVLHKKLGAKIEEELYKLDYEDIIDDLPTRFKYRSVEEDNYGLTAEEILTASDSALKQYVSLKKMAPYAEERFIPGSKRRKRFREILQKELSTTDGEVKVTKDSLTIGDDTTSSKIKSKKRRQKKRSKNSQNTIS